jgi:hypothetical protein
MLNEDDLNQQQRVKRAFDPAQILNPGQVFPQLHCCAEFGRLHVHRGRLRCPELPRFQPAVSAPDRPSAQNGDAHEGIEARSAHASIRRRGIADLRVGEKGADR